MGKRTEYFQYLYKMRRDEHPSLTAFYEQCRKEDRKKKTRGSFKKYITEALLLYLGQEHSEESLLLQRQEQMLQELRDIKDRLQHGVALTPQQEQTLIEHHVLSEDEDEHILY